MGITRDGLHKRRASGGKRVSFVKKRQYNLGRPASNTKIGERRVHTVRTRGGNTKQRGLSLDSGNYSWASQGVARKTRVLTVSYNSTNNELVRTNTLVKGEIVQIDATPFRAWYEKHYGIHLGKRKAVKDGEAPSKKAKKDSKSKDATKKEAVKPKKDVVKSEPKKDAAKSEPKKDVAKAAVKKDVVKSEPKKDSAKSEPKKDSAKSEPKKDVAKDTKKSEPKKDVAKVEVKKDAKVEVKKDAAKSEPKKDAKRDSAKGKSEHAEGEKPKEKKKKLPHSVVLEKRLKERIPLDGPLEEQFNTGRLFAQITTRPGQTGAIDGAILEGKELEFYLKKMQKKKK